jgi:hypothetical protein
MSEDVSFLLSVAKDLTFQHKVGVIPANEHKQPACGTVVDKRGKLSTAEELVAYFGHNEDKKARWLAVLLDSPIPLGSLDLDGTGVRTFQNKVIPRCSEQLRIKIEKTMKTKTPNNGLHILFRIRQEDFPSGIQTRKYWIDIANGKRHNEINLMGTGHYMVERGLGYVAINGPESLVTMSKEDMLELLKILEEFEKETKAVRNSANKLAEYYQPTNRDNLVFALSGYLHKSCVLDYLIKDLVEYLIELVGGDEESEKRFDTVKITCTKDRGVVSGRDRLLEGVNRNEAVITSIEEEFGNLGYHFNTDRRNSKSENGSKTDGEKKSIVTIALELIEDDIENLFVDKFEVPFVTVNIYGHLETLPIRRNKFKKWICKKVYESEDKPMNSEALGAVCNVVEARALFSGNIKALDLRVSNGSVDVSGDDQGETDTRHSTPQQGTFYYDLINGKREVVKITREGWSIEEPSNVSTLFYRYQGQLPQVRPLREYPADIFDQYMDLVDATVRDKDGKMVDRETAELRLLLKCYVIALFIPNIAKVILIILGEQGSAKTVFMELTKNLVDPSSVPTLTFPRNMAEVVQQLSHNYIAYYDNVSVIGDWISDALCRAATGTGFSKRELYTDDDDIIYQFTRSVGLSAIHLPGTKPDLLDRSIIVKKSFIDKKHRRKYKEDILPKFERIKPQLLGYIFDILVKVLQVKANGGINLETRSRMADWEEDAEIISRCMGDRDMDFINAYHDNIKLQTDAILEERPVARALIELIESEPDHKWSGSMTELLAVLESVATKLKIRADKDMLWPKAANKLSYRLNELKTNLRDIGISINETKDPKTRLKTLVICKLSSEPSEPSESLDLLSDAAKSSDDSREFANDILSIKSQVSPDKQSEYCAQNQVLDDSKDPNDTLRTPSAPYSCPYCSSLKEGNVDAMRFGTSDLYLDHVVNRHTGWTPYPTPSDVEKFKLEIKGKMPIKE